MSVRPAIVLTIAFIILLPVYLWGRPEVRRNNQLKEKQESLLKLDAIDAVTLARGTEVVRFQKTADGKLFSIIQPASAFAPQDLMQAITVLLINAKQVEVISENLNDLSQYGLDQPKTTLTVEAKDKPQPIKILFGAENPTHTAIYAEIVGVPKVFLLGSNLEYYQTLLFEWIEGKQGKNA
ncbi:MAG TPA: DUF4340 domain-containing protein [Candidatus Binataceae bacterium]|nr:DUF4340 domain-containing protein [Candidatus Binataceae bacterium]